MSTGSDQRVIGGGFLQSAFLKWCECSLRAKEHREKASEFDKEAKALELRIADHCESNGISSFRVKDGPSATIKLKKKVWVLKEKEAEAKEWLRANGLDRVITPHYAALNSAINSLEEAAVERNEVFNLPDCFSSEIVKDISPRYNGWDLERIEQVNSNSEDMKGRAA